MDVAALIAWVVTAGGGGLLLGTWLLKGGLAQQRRGPTRIRTAIVFTHFGLAAAGLVLWIVFVATGRHAAAWAAAALLAVIATLGFSMFLPWLAGRGAARTATDERPAEDHFPVLVVYLHGAAA